MGIFAPALTFSAWALVRVHRVRKRSRVLTRLGKVTGDFKNWAFPLRRSQTSRISTVGWIVEHDAEMCELIGRVADYPDNGDLHKNKKEYPETSGIGSPEVRNEHA